MTKTIHRICPVCNTKYTAEAIRLKFGRQTTCSRRCSYDLRNRNKLVDLTGKVFNRWTVLGKNKSLYWDCICICGNKRAVFQSSLLSGKSQSCGCLGGGRKKLPFRDSPEYMVWSNMKRRCNDPNNAGYVYYGARGIKVCDRWLVFENFIADMGLRTSPKHSLDRVDNDGNYEPSNCRWATAKEQVANRRPYGTAR